MPSINCKICGKINRIPTQEWKLILSDEPYVCSAKCVKKWIESHPLGKWRPAEEALEVKQEADGYVNYSKLPYRSDFERRVGYFFIQNQLMYEYEKWGFKVGNGTYTPDFYFYEFDCFVETKGLWRLGAKRKFRLFRKMYPNIPILVIPWTIQSDFGGNDEKIQIY